MSNPQAPAEPSMEEILASIRRIIAEGRPSEGEPDPPEPEEPTPPPEPSSAADTEGPSPSPSPEPGDPPLVLTRMVAEGGSVLTVAPGELGQGEVIAVEEALLLTEPLPAETSRPTAPAPPEAAQPASPPVPRQVEPPLRPAATEAPAAGPVAPLDPALPPAESPQAASPQPAPPQPASPAPPPAPPASPAIRAGRTIDEIAREALEPMLKAWLDQHLREIVERRVQEEIDRISRKSES